TLASAAPSRIVASRSGRSSEGICRSEGTPSMRLPYLSPLRGERWQMPGTRRSWASTLTYGSTTEPRGAQPRSSSWASKDHEHAGRRAVRYRPSCVRVDANGRVTGVTRPNHESIPVVVRLEGAGVGNADVFGLVGAQLGELDADLLEVQRRHLLVQH